MLCYTACGEMSHVTIQLLVHQVDYFNSNIHVFILTLSNKYFFVGTEISLYHLVALVLQGK